MGHRSCYVCRRVSQANDKDSGASWRGDQTRAEGEDSSTVCGGTFWENDGDTGGVLAKKGVEIDEMCSWRRINSWMGERPVYCLKKGDGLHQAGIWIGGHKGGIEDGSKIEGIDGRSSGGSNDGALLRQSSTVLGQRAERVKRLEQIGKEG